MYNASVSITNSQSPYIGSVTRTLDIVFGNSD